MEALRVSSALGEELRAMEIRLIMAAIALAGNQAGEAAVRARQAAAWYQQRASGGESEALSVLAESQMRQGLRGEAKATAARRASGSTPARTASSASPSVSVGKIEAGTGNAAEALRQLSGAVARRCEPFGLVAACLEARLALGEVQRGGRRSGDRHHLAAVRKDGRGRGFKRLGAGGKQGT